MRRLLTPLLFGALAMPALADDEPAGVFEVVAKVEKAIALLREDEKQALEALGDPDGDFVWKDTYVFVVDCEADRIVSDPAFPELVGGNIRQLVDFAGHPFGAELCHMASAPAGSWIESYWVPPGQDEPVRKLSYVRSVHGTSFQVGAGVYDYAMTQPRRYSEFGDGA